jgi:NADH:ubiquinone oxidoreductase subunit E
MRTRRSYSPPEFRPADVDEIVRREGGDGAHVIQILQAIQKRYRYLPREALRHVCEVTTITPAQITGVSTFYTQFRHEPVGRYIIRVCHGTACYVRGAERITEALRNQLGIDEGLDTDPQRLFTVEKVNCIGCCSLAPCMMIESVTYGHLSPQNVHRACDRFLKDYGE